MIQMSCITGSSGSSEVVQMPIKMITRKADVMVKIQGIWDEKLPILAQEILNDCNQYCKEENGILIASSLTHSELDRGRLIWDTPYAKRQYWEIRTAYTDVNPHATWRWCEYAKNANIAKWEMIAQRLMGGGSP